MSDYIRRFNAAMAELDRAGLLRVGPEEAGQAPQVPALYSKFGIQVRPMPYASLSQILLTLGLGFTVFFGVVMWIVVWQARGLPGTVALLISLLAGLIFGIGTFLNYRRMRRKNDLSDWDDL